MFSDEQRYVINENSKNILLLARAGSGKTYTVANKIAQSIKSGVRPQEILCLTFTVKGAQELKEDVHKYCDESEVNIFTIHSFCYYIIKEYLSLSGAFITPSIADEVDVGEILVEIIKSYAEKGEYNLSDGLPLLPEKQLAKIMSAVKHERDELGFAYSSENGYGVAINNLLEKSESFNSQFSTRKRKVKVTDYDLLNLFKRRGNEFSLKYQSVLKSSLLLDFDDLIFFAKEILSSKDYKKPVYKLIIIDEMQDTSMLEYEVARKFFDGAQVLMCGDPYQTIYSWRGSSPFDVMDDFIKNFNAEEVSLGKNYRSSPLLTYAGRYYLWSTFGDKNKRPEEQTFLDEQKIDVVQCYDDYSEADFVYDYIKNYEGDRSSICVMARANRYLSDLYRHFERKNLLCDKSERIPFFTADSDFQFYKKPVIKDFLCFLKLLVNPADTPSFTRIAEKYVKGVGKETLSAIKDFGAYGVSLSSFLTGGIYYGEDPLEPLTSAYKSKNVVVYDLETTGLDTKADQMIQISAKKLTGESFNSFVIPTVEISEKALKTHGYGLDYVKALGGREAKEVLKDFCEFCGNAILIGHNSSSYDDIILLRQLSEVGQSYKFSLFYDTLTLSQTVLPNLQNYKLATLCEHFGIVNERAHDAFADVEATEKLLIKLCEDFYLPQTDARKRVVLSKANKFREFYESYSQMQTMFERGEVLNLIKFIDDKFGVLKVNSRLSDRESANDLYRTLKPLEDESDKKAWLRSFLSDTALSGSQLDVIVKKHGKIPLITVHQSKGCEFDTVIFVGVGENEIPSFGARLSGDESEEKRVFYVALTRAKKNLIITYPANSVHGQNVYMRNPSPYIKRLPAEAINLKTRD